MSLRLKSLGAAIVAMLGSAAGSGYLAADPGRELVRRPEDDETSTPPPLLLTPPSSERVLIAHGSHRSHASHASHSSGGGGHASHASHASHYSSSGTSSSSSSSSNDSSRSSSTSSRGSTTPSPTPPPKPRPAKVSLIAFPGGRISLDGKVVGDDATGVLRVLSGRYTIKVQNRFLGDHEETIDVTEGDNGTVRIDW